MEIGQNALNSEEYVLSIQYFSQVIKIKPYLAEPFLMRAIAKINLGDFQGADQDCTEAIECNPFMPFAFYARGFARRGLEFYPEAIADFTKALEFSPNSQYLLLNRIDTRERNKDYEGALSDMETYQRLNPNATSTYFDKGRIQMALKDTASAKISFERYIEKDSLSSIGWSAMAFLKMQKNDTDGALKDYNQAIKRNSKFAGDYINRGILNVGKKNYKQALADYNAAIKLDKKNEIAYVNRALLRANLGDNNNALADITTALSMDSSNVEARYNKALMEMTLRNYRNAIKDYKKIINIHQYFIPAYQGIAQAEEALGNGKEAFRYRQLASNIEKNKKEISRKEKDKIISREKIATNTQKTSVVGDKTSLFNRFAVHSNEEAEAESKYNNSTRGMIQQHYTDIVNEKDFILTYYVKTDELRQTNVYHPELDKYNKAKKLGSILKLTNNEIPLTAEMISDHFEIINTLSSTVASEKNADVYFNLALEFALVQDYTSAVESLNKCIELRSDFMLAYFFRAEARNKLLEVQKIAKSGNAVSIDTKARATDEKTVLFEVEMIIQDYDKTIEMAPDFSFAYYNKANLLCTQKDFKTAIVNYTKAIAIDADFAEAYFNRGLTQLFIGEDAKGLADLSKAGELGIYKAYNLLQRFKK